MQAIDIEGYEAWLQKRSLADERRAPFYARWVRRFLQAQREGSNLSDEDRLLEFSDVLGRDSGVSTDPRSGKMRRHHIGEVVLQRAMREAVE